MANVAVYSTMVRAGRKTFFIDVKQTKTGSKQLVLTQADLNAMDRHVKSVITVEANTVDMVRLAVEEACKVMQEG